MIEIHGETKETEPFFFFSKCDQFLIRQYVSWSLKIFAG